MVELDTLVQPVLDDAPDPPPFGLVRARARVLRHQRVTRTVLSALVSVSIIATTAVVIAATRDDRPTNTVGIHVTSSPHLEVGQPTTFQQPAMDMLAAFGSIWISQPDQVARLDPSSGRVIATIPVPGTSDLRNLAAGAGALWIDDTAKETVTRIDPVRNRVAATIPMHEKVFVVDGLAFLDGKLWVARPAPNDDSQGDVVAVDPATNRIVQRVPIPRTLTVVRGGTHALWYVRRTDLLRFDTRTLHTSVVRHDVIDVLVAAGGHLWLHTTDGVIETDERTSHQIGRTIRFDAVVNLTATVGASGAVWLAGQPDSSSPGTVRPYDIITHRPAGRARAIGLPIAALAEIDGSLWVDAGGPIRIPFRD